MPKKISIYHTIEPGTDAESEDLPAASYGEEELSSSDNEDVVVDAVDDAVVELLPVSSKLDELASS